MTEIYSTKTGHDAEIGGEQTQLKYADIGRIAGTLAEQADLNMAGYAPGTLYWVTDQGTRLDEWNGSSFKFKSGAIHGDDDGDRLLVDYPVGMYFYGPTGNVWRKDAAGTDASDWTLIETGGSGHVHTEGGAGVGQSYNREASAAQLTTLTSTAVTYFTWPAGSRPTKIKVKPIGGAVWVCFDAPDAATALTWCQGASGSDTDSQRYLVPEYIPEAAEVAGGTAGDYGVQPTEADNEFPFTDGLSNMYVLEYTNGAVTGLTVEAS